MLKGRRKYIIYSMILLLIVGLSVGFSAFQKQLLIDDSIFKVRLQEDTRVSASVVEKTSGDAVSNSEDYNVSKIYGNVTFPTTSSYVLYKVDLTNYGNVKTGLLNITSNTSGVNYSICNSSGSNCSNDPKTAVCSGSNCTLGSTKTIYVKVTSTSAGTKNIDLDLEFEPYHTITYYYFNENTSSFQSEIMENDTYEVTLTSDVEEVGVSGTGYASYNKNNHKLTISGVTSNITLTAKYLLTDIAETSYSGSNPDNYVRFNNELYRIVTKEIIDDGYGNEELRGKIVKVDSIGKNPFDTNGSDIFEESSINVVLNTTYYNTLSDEAKNLIDTSNWHDELGYYGYIAFVSKNDYQDNSSWLTFETYTSTWYDDGCYYSIQNGILKIEGTSTSLDTHPTTYLKKDVLIVGGTGTSTNPYILELKGDGLQPNPTKITARTLTMNGSNQNLITVENQLGVPHYSVGTRIDADNYDDYNGTIPQRSAVGEYYVFYYIPAVEGFKPKSGSVTAHINGIKYTINYTKGDNVSSIGKDSDSCTTTGTNTTCSVTLPSITPASGWENGKWNYNSTEYNPNTSFTLNSTNSGLTMTSSVTGKTYTATIYYYDGSNVSTLTRTCNVTSGNSCNVTLPNTITNSKGVYNSDYKGIASDKNTMTSSTTLTLTSSATYYTVYSKAVTNYYYNGTSYTTRTLYRNEYFKSNSELDSRLSTANDNTTNYTAESGVGSSTFVGLSTANDTTAEYNSIESAAASTSTTLYTIYQLSVNYEKGSHVSSIGASGGTCKITNQNNCSVTLPSITPSTGYTSVGWSTTNGDTTGVTGSYTINTNNTTLYANAIGATYTATFYYYNGSSIATATSNCTVSNVEGNCTVSVPNVVQSSNGQYGGTYKGVAASASTMDIASSMVINNNTTKYYAIYSTNITRYYYSSGYKSGTIYRNEFFIDDSTMNAVLTASDVGTVNYTSARGPGSSNWLGLSTALDTTPEYSSVSAAAKSTNTTFYTVYQFVVNFSLGSNVAAIGSTLSSCNVTTSDTTCTVIFPSITPNTGYMSVGWSLTNGDTTGEPALSLYTVTNNNRVFYANAIGANYINTTTNEGYSTLNDAFGAVSNNQTIKVLQDVTETTNASLASGKTGVKLDLNGKTITMSSSYILNNGTLDIYNTSSSTGTITGGNYQVLYNYGTLSLNGTSTTNKIIIDKTANNNSSGSIINNSSKSLTVNDNVEIKVSSGSSYGIVNSGTTTISGGTITAQTSGISNQTTGELNISGNNTSINGNTAYGIVNLGIITISGGTITGSSYGIDNSGNTSGAVTISGGTITGSSGIYNRSGGELNISGDSTQIIGTSSYGINNSGATTINGGTITGSCGIYNQSGGELNISGDSTQIIGTSSYGINNPGTATINGGTITAPTSGISNSGTATVSGGTVSGNRYGINMFSEGQTIITGGTVTGEETGIYNNNGTIDISGSSTQIVGNTEYGIWQNQSNGKTTITGGTITGSYYGIHLVYGQLTLGVKDSNISTSNPLIQTTGTSAKFGINNTNGSVFNFYDGIIKSASGTGYSINGAVTDIPVDYEITKETVNGVESAYLTKISHLMIGDSGNQTRNYLRTNIAKQDIESITFTNSIGSHTANGTDCFDVSKDEDGGVLAWVTDSNSNGKYEMTIGANGNVKAYSGEYLFNQLRYLSSLNGLQYLDTSEVTDMNYMFDYTGYNSTSLNLDLSYLDVSNVTKMNSMFASAGYNNPGFTLNLGPNFDTSNVTGMTLMFAGTGAGNNSFTLDLGDKFDTSKVTTMSYMFNGTGRNSTVFTLDLEDKFDTSNVTSMVSMFDSTGIRSTSFTLDLGDKFDTTKVTNMGAMFSNTGYISTVFTLDLGDKFDTSNVTNMSGMFSNTGYSSTVFTLDLGDKFDTSKVTNMSGMFRYAGSSSNIFTLDLGDKFDTSIVTNMEFMFFQTGYSSTSFTLDLGDKFDTSNVTTMYSMFSNTGYSSTVFTLDLGDKFDTSNVQNMNRMFYQIARNTTNFTLDLGSEFDTSRVTDMGYMFAGSRYLKTIYAPSSFVTTAVTNSANMFDGCTSLVGGAGTVYSSSHIDAAYAHIDGGTSNPGYFTGPGGTLMEGNNGSQTTNYLRTNIAKQDIESITFTNSLGSHTVNGTDCFDVSKDNNGTVIAWAIDSNSNDKYEITIGANGKVKAYSGNNLFSETRNLDSLNGIDYLDISEVTDMAFMFSKTGYYSTTFTLDLGNKFDTSKVTDMSYMFADTGSGSSIFNLNLGDKFDTSKVTNMEWMFYHAGGDSSIFTLDLGDKFDTSKVTDMSYMFYQTGGGTSFTLDLGDKFNTSSVTNMGSMFAQTGHNSTVFTLDLGDKFDTSNVTSMESMFSSTGYSSTIFTLDLGDKFDTSKVTNMEWMFSNIGKSNTGFILDLGDKFDTSNVTNMRRMFSGVGLLDLGEKFDTSKVTDMGGMFSQTGFNITNFTLDLGDKFDTSNVTNMQSMFSSTGYSSTTLTLDLGDKFDTSNVTDMGGMFSSTGYSSATFTLDLGDKFDTLNVVDMSGMFSNIGYGNSNFVLDLGDKFDTSSVTNMSSMFSQTGYSNTNFTLNLGDKFDTSNVVDMSYMFYETGNSNTSFVLDLGDKFDTSNVTNMSYMFYNNSNLNTIYVPSSFVTTSVTNSRNMFYGCTSLVGGAGTSYSSSNPKDQTYAHIDGGTSNPGYFTGPGGTLMAGNSGTQTENYLRTNIARQDIESITFVSYLGNHTANGTDCFDVSKDNNGEVLAWVTDSNSNSKYEMTIGANGDVKAYSGYYLFSELRNLNSLNGMNYFDTSQVTDMSYMFSKTGYYSTSFTLDLGNKFDTSKVTNMEWMFYRTGYNNTVFTLDLGDRFDTSNVTTMEDMFDQTGYSSTTFTLDLGDKFDTTNVKNMLQMFYCTGYTSRVFTLDLGDKFDTSKVTTMYNMFYDTGDISTVFTLDLGDKFDTSNVTDMGAMFASTGYSSTSFTLDLGDKFDTSSVTNMVGMFDRTGYSSTVFTLDLGDKFDTSNVTNMLGMFSNTGYSSTVFTLDLGDKFDTSNVTDMYRMFSNTGYNSTVFTLDLGDKFDTSNVTAMNNMFYQIARNTTNFTLDLGSEFDTSRVTDMSYMFAGSRYLKTIYAPSSFVTTAVTNSANMFDGCTSLVGGAGTVYSSSHIDAAYAHIDGGTSNPGYFTGPGGTLMEGNNGSQTTNYLRTNIAKQDIESITFVSYLGNHTANGTDCFDVSKDNNGEVLAWVTDTDSNSKYEMTIGANGNVKASSGYYLFSDLRNLDSLNGMDYLDTFSVTNMVGMFNNTGRRSTVFTLDLGDKFNTTNVTNMQAMFYNTGYSSPVFTLDLGDKFDTSNVIDMYNMFYYTGRSNTVFTLDLGDKFDTSNVTNMWGMFNGTGYSSTSFTLDLGDKFDTSSVTNMIGMFFNTGISSPVFTLDLGDKFNTTNVTNMQGMFESTGHSSTVFTLDLGDKFDTSNVTDMSYMFNDTGYSSTVFTLDLGDKFDTTNVTTMRSMFDKTGYSSPVFTLDLGDKFDTSNVTNMTHMFAEAGYSSASFTLDLGDKFDTSRVTDMSYMFYNSRYLKTIYAPSSFVTTAVTDSEIMFYRCTSLVGGAGTVYSNSYDNATRAHIDGGTSNPGYFTSRSAIGTNVSNNNSLMNLSNSVSNGGDAILNKIEEITNKSNKKGK